METQAMAVGVGWPNALQLEAMGVALVTALGTAAMLVALVRVKRRVDRSRTPKGRRGRRARSVETRPGDPLDRTAAKVLGHSELDWVLIDADGACGLFSSAGFGHLPDVLLGLGPLGIKQYEEWLLPALCDDPAAGSWSSEAMSELHRLGLYVFDWDGSCYKRESSPDKPVRAAELRAVLAPFAAAIPTADVRFGDSEKIHLPDVVASRNRDRVVER